MSDESDFISNPDELEDGSIGDEAYEEDTVTQSGLFPTPEPVLPLAVQQAIIDSYRQCWREFYEDEQALCSQALAQLACVNASHDTETEMIIRMTDLEATSTLSSHSIDYVMTDFSPSGVARQHSVKGTMSHLPAIVPGPRYHACSPSDAYVYKHGPDLIVLESIRYGGVRAPGFDERAFMRLFRSVAWQTSFQDPDYYLIAKETLHRIGAIKQRRNIIDDGESMKPTLEDIAAINIFPPMNTGTVQSDVDRIWDIIQRAGHRDEWRWPRARYPVNLPITEDDDRLSRTHTAQRDSTNRFARLSYSFCAYLECIRAVCPSHPYHTGWREESTVVPQVTNRGLQMNGKAPCGSECYQHSTTTTAADIPTEELEFLKSCFVLKPDELPCIIASLLKGVTCQQVFAYRVERIPDNAVMGPPRKVDLPRSFQFKDDGTVKPDVVSADDGPVTSNVVPEDNVSKTTDVEFTPVEPCTCRGSCYLQPDCKCYSQSLHCQRNCQCNKDCVLRYKGCKCCTKARRKKNRQCRPPPSKKSESSCRCLRAERECDPERCLNHRETSTVKKLSKDCRAFDLQLATFPRIEVKAGAYGFGGFATTDLRKGTFIDYVAEKFPTSGAFAYESIADFAHLNYSFTLDPTEALDAFFVGNETRFLNDPRDESFANVTASNRYIDGNHHIAYYTTKRVRKGEELLLLYGDNYWNIPSEKERKVQEEKARLGLDEYFEEDLLFE